jgi:hypothetical protein
MKNIFFLIFLPLLLAACDSVKDTPGRVLDNVEANTSATWNKAREYLGVGHKLNTPKDNTQPRYCYRAFEDITCYSQPIATDANRLVAYQTKSGQTGYVIHKPAPAKAEAAPADKKKTADKKKPAPTAKKPAAKKTKKDTKKDSKEGATGINTADQKDAKDSADAAKADTQKDTVDAPAQKKEEKQLKEIIFDPAELQPKELVPAKPQ